MTIRSVCRCEFLFVMGQREKRGPFHNQNCLLYASDISLVVDASQCEERLDERQCLLDKGHEGMHEVAAGGNWNTAFFTFHHGDGHKPFPLPEERPLRVRLRSRDD